MWVSVCVSCRRSVQLGHPSSLTCNLATSVVPEHSLYQMVCQYVKDLRKCLNKTSHIYLYEGTIHHICQPRETMLMIKLNGLCVFSFFFQCVCV